MASKSTANIAILKILMEKTSPSNPITYDAIVSCLEKDYLILMERKAIGRNISALKEFGFDITVTSRGAYLEERDFEDAEVRLLIDDVLSNRYIGKINGNQLIEKLKKLGSPTLREHTKYADKSKSWAKTPNNEVFLNIEVIDEAIEKGKQISFDYCIYNNKYELIKKHPNLKSIVSPYRMVVKNQRYYLMCQNMDLKALSYYKIDKIKNIKILDEKSEDINNLKSFTHGVNDEILSNALPYLFSDVPVNVKLKVISESAIDYLVDWFGISVKFLRGNNSLYATVKVSQLAMKYWALQYINDIEVVSPYELRASIQNELEQGCKRYSS